MEDLKNRVDELLENQEYDKALELLTENEMNGETDTWTNSTTGWILGKLGRREEALEYLRKVEGEGEESSWLCCEIGWN